MNDVFVDFTFYNRHSLIKEVHIVLSKYINEAYVADYDFFIVM